MIFSTAGFLISGFIRAAVNLAVSLLTDEIVAKSSYAGVVRRALDKVTEIPAELVPRTSLIREFISGGIYEDLY